jgi:hypothetical protein
MTPAPFLSYKDMIMTNVRSFLLLGLVGFGLVACGDSTPSVTAPGAPRYDEGGHTVGSGSKDPAPQSTAGSTSEAVSDSTSGEDGGHTVGSGS